MLIEISLLVAVSVTYFSGFLLSCCSKSRRDTMKMMGNGAIHMFQRKTMAMIYEARSSPYTKDGIEIDFYYHCTPYKLPLKIKRGPKRIPEITTKQGDDLVPGLRPYMGPNLDFYGVPVSPKELGFPDGFIMDGAFIPGNQSILKR